MNALARILAHKRRELNARSRRPLPPAEPQMDLPAISFLSALTRPDMSVIAEIKRKSPSRGVIREGVDIADIATLYRVGGAAAISVLTDQRFFGGTGDDLVKAKKAASLPVLRKDFLIDPTQIEESVRLGADAVLLIVAALSDGQLGELIRLARQSGLDALVEVHSERELERALSCGAVIIGVNSRDLTTMKVDPDVCMNLRRNIPAHCVAVAESGIRSRDDVLRLHNAGYNVVLIGETLMTAVDPAQRLMELTGNVFRHQDAAASVTAEESGT